MPLLAVHFDTSVVNFLLKKDKEGAEFYTFPYVYSKSTLSNQLSEADFYKKLIDKFLTGRGVKFSACDIVVSGFVNLPKLNFEPKLSVGVNDLIHNSEDMVPIFVDNFSVFTKDTISSSKQFLSDLKLSTENAKDFGEYDYYANLTVYPQTISDDISTQSQLDENIFKQAPSDLKVETGRKIIFTGGRFTQYTSNEELSYILMLSLLKGVGAYTVFLDKKNAFSLYQTAKMYDKDLQIILEDYVESIGTIIKTGGSVECLLKGEVGEGRFFEIEKDKILVIPLDPSSHTTLNVKNNLLGSLEIPVKGGEVGLIFDTRDSNSNIYSNMKMFNECVKQFGDALEGK